MRLYVLVDGVPIGDTLTKAQWSIIRKSRENACEPETPPTCVPAPNDTGRLKEDDPFASCPPFDPIAASAQENTDIIKSMMYNMPICTSEMSSGGGEMQVLGGLAGSVNVNVVKDTETGCQDFSGAVSNKGVQNCTASSILNSLSVSGSMISNLAQILSIRFGPNSDVACENITACQVMSGCLRFVQSVDQESKNAIIASIKADLQTEVQNKVDMVSSGIVDETPTDCIQSLNELINNEVISSIVDETIIKLVAMSTATQNMEFLVEGKMSCKNLVVSQIMSISLVVESMITKISDNTINSTVGLEIYNNFVTENHKEQEGLDPTIEPPPTIMEILQNIAPYAIGGVVLIGGIALAASLFKGKKEAPAVQYQQQAPAQYQQPQYYQPQYNYRY